MKRDSLIGLVSGLTVICFVCFVFDSNQVRFEILINIFMMFVAYHSILFLVFIVGNYNKIEELMELRNS